jgi:hypothetical protein
VIYAKNVLEGREQDVYPSLTKVYSLPSTELPAPVTFTSKNSPMSDAEDGDFEDSRELSGSDNDVGEDSEEASESVERPQRLKLTLKPRNSGPSTPRTRGTGRPRGRPRGSGSGLTLKVRRKQPDVVMDEPETPPAPTPAAETGETSSANHNLYSPRFGSHHFCGRKGVRQSW